MDQWKLPPKAKIFEALSAVVDGRVKVTGETSATVTSSSLDRTYTITWSPDLDRITSDDNASRWQGYTGYPIIAVLLVKGKIPFDARIASHLVGIPWKEINRQFRNDYARAVESVLASLEEKGINTASIREEVEKIMSRLEGLALKKLPKRTIPARDRLP
jgi:hypothetical protein